MNYRKRSLTKKEYREYLKIRDLREFFINKETF